MPRKKKSMKQLKRQVRKSINQTKSNKISLEFLISKVSIGNAATTSRTLGLFSKYANR